MYLYFKCNKLGHNGHLISTAYIGGPEFDKHNDGQIILQHQYNEMVENDPLGTYTIITQAEYEAHGQKYNHFEQVK